MRIAILSDIHGNLTAFQAVVRDLRDVAPDLILHGGDLADGGSRPVEIVQDRARVVEHARRFCCRFVAVWISCSLDVALAQNSARPSDEVVPEEVVRLVFNDFEPPTFEEGFDVSDYGFCASLG